MSFDDKSNWLRHFQHRLNTFFQEFLKSAAHPLGEIQDYGIRIEFQARGLPHAHCVIWVKNAPTYATNSPQEICDFIDKYISCSLPSEDSKLKDLVSLLQQHKHSSYCRRKNVCRFNFPHPPNYSTIIAEPNDELNHDDTKYNKEVLSKVRKAINETKDKDLTLDNY